MPFLNGTYKRLQSWVARQAAGANISAVEFDADGNDIAAALSTCLLRDGSGVPTADIPFNSKGITGIRAGVAAGEAVEYSQFISTTVGSQRLQNAGFLVNARAVAGTVTLTTGQYGHDRWKAGSSGCTYTFAANGPDIAVTITAGSLIQVVHASEIEGGIYSLSQAGTAQGRVWQVSAPSFATCPFSTSALTAATTTNVEFSTGTIIRPMFEPGASVHAFARRSLILDQLACCAYYERNEFDLGWNVNGYMRMSIQYRTPKILFGTVTPTITTGTTFTSQTFTDASNTQNKYATAVILLFNASTNNVAGRITGYVICSCEP